MKILVGLSGGVDSSVAALILKQQGHEVVGATMSIWGKDGMAAKSGHKNACYGPDEKKILKKLEKLPPKLVFLTMFSIVLSNMNKLYWTILNLNTFKAEHLTLVFGATHL